MLLDHAGKGVSVCGLARVTFALEDLGARERRADVAQCLVVVLIHVRLDGARVESNDEAGDAEKLDLRTVRHGPWMSSVYRHIARSSPAPPLSHGASLFVVGALSSRLSLRRRVVHARIPTVWCAPSQSSSRRELLLLRALCQAARAAGRVIPSYPKLCSLEEGVV